MTTIYALCDPLTGEVRYIGKTVRKPRQRLRDHIVAARGDEKTHRANWIRSLASAPAMRPLVVVPDQYGAEMEIRTIAHWRCKGYRLTNQSDGGDGTLGCRQRLGHKNTPEHNARISASLKGRRMPMGFGAKMRAARLGKTMPAEVKAKIRASCLGKNLGRKYSPEIRARMSDARVGKQWSAKRRASGNAALRGRVRSESVRMRIAASLLGKKHTPERRASRQRDNIPR